MSAIKLAFKKSYRECKFFKKTTPLNLLYALLFDYLIVRGKARSIHNFAKCIGFTKNPLLEYFIARVHFLLGNYSTATIILIRLNKKFPRHAEIAYLLSDSLNRENKPHAARDVLEETLKKTHRLKTWLMLANLIKSDCDYQRLKNLWKAYKKKGTVPSYHYSVDSYISTAAMRSENYADAIKLWQSFIFKTINKESIFPSNCSGGKFSSRYASKALIDLKYTLQARNIDFFLISGTLLGCIRENRLLSHDKDIDIGVWSDHSIAKLIDCIKNSGLFYIQAARSDLALRIKHVNGTAIDIFLHFRESSNYWHGGAKLKWNNTPFSLIEHKFLNENFLIPKEYDLYLSENYGNWRIKKSNFDSAFDTPNASLINISEMIVHTYKALAKSLQEGNLVETNKNIETLREFGENEFCFKISSLLEKETFFSTQL